MFVTGPKTLTYRRAPLNGPPVGFVVGVRGLPCPSTTAVVGVFPKLVTVLALPLFQLSKYRKMPFRAQGVSTTGFWVVRARTMTSSNNAKKNVLFFFMGPPRLPVN